MPVLGMSRSLPRALLGVTGRRPKDVFTRIYAENLWADEGFREDKEFPFYSGPGSGEQAAIPYAECVNAFIDTHHIRSVVDLGCGDFRVGRRIARPGLHYTGVDVVEPLIRANQARYGKYDIKFRDLDIVAETLPSGELCLVREVLQHLSNAQIKPILAKLKQFKWAIVTETLPGPVGSFRPNRDRPFGREARVTWDSGTVLTEPPFGAQNVKLLLEVPGLRSERKEKERISSFLLSN